ncbi:MAG TPA: NIPSNAP family protein [Pyrinomonadaceae bacterium]|jgi:hypothetical protein|nr:NIPSNAP family protein [Pyrinomonadaceae bacterium]
MKRRTFLASSLAASCVAASTSSAGALAAGLNMQNDVKPEYYELRLYHLRRGAKTKMMDDYFGGAALPAMKRAGVGPVGFFNVVIGPDSPTLYVLFTHKTLESVATAAGRLAADAEYQKAGAAFLNAPATDPTYVRMESSLMVAFSGMPKLEVPAGVAEKKSRLFELRTYESHSKSASRKKIEMFNTGETALFRRTGLQPVFFGETLIGTKLPNLTYMLTFPDMATRDKNWGTFIADPEWKKMSATPGFTDAEIVTNISSVFLRPTSYSEI